MSTLTPLETLTEPDGEYTLSLPLPAELRRLYGSFPLPPHQGSPYVIANFVSSLDGVVSLEIPGHAGGAEISGFNPHDRMVMGLLRAMADAVIVGAGTLRAVAADHLWTAAYIFPTLAGAYQELRDAMGKSEPPLNVVVTARGELDLAQRLFQSGEVAVLIVTTRQGEQRLRQQTLPESLQVCAVSDAPDGQLSAHAILEAVGSVRPARLVLLEGGPHLIASFFAEKCLHEFFLTLAPQVAGRERAGQRPSFVLGRNFAPEQPIWAALAGVKRAGSHLFLRYAFEQVHG